MTNQGSIPAKIGGVSVAITDKYGETIDVEDPVVKDMIVHYRFDMGSGSDTMIIAGNCNLTELESKLNAENIESDDGSGLKGVVIDPKEYITTGVKDGDKLSDTFYFNLPGRALNGNAGQDETIKVVITFDFVQYNEDITTAE